MMKKYLSLLMVTTAVFATTTPSFSMYPDDEATGKGKASRSQSPTGRLSTGSSSEQKEDETAIVTAVPCEEEVSNLTMQSFLLNSQNYKSDIPAFIREQDIKLQFRRFVESGPRLYNVRHIAADSINSMPLLTTAQDRLKQAMTDNDYASALPVSAEPLFLDFQKTLSEEGNTESNVLALNLPENVEKYRHWLSQKIQSNEEINTVLKRQREDASEYGRTIAKTLVPMMAQQALISPVKNVVKFAHACLTLYDTCGEEAREQVVMLDLRGLYNQLNTLMDSANLALEQPQATSVPTEGTVAIVDSSEEKTTPLEKFLMDIAWRDIAVSSYTFDQTIVDQAIRHQQRLIKGEASQKVAESFKGALARAFASRQERAQDLQLQNEAKAKRLFREYTHMMEAGEFDTAVTTFDKMIDGQ